MSDEQVPTGQGGDLYAKTLSLLRRLFVGNGYKLEEVQIRQLENTDYKLPGKLILELEVKHQTKKLFGPARGGEARVFNNRADEQTYISSIREQMGQENWLDEVRSLIEKTPGGGWGMEDGSWPLPRLSQRIALQMTCDLCQGRRTQNCDVCHGFREIMCQDCNGGGLMTCPGCYGNGGNPAQPGQPCPRCQGRRQIPCLRCQGRQKVMCPTCKGNGQIECRDCQGHGFQTEETSITCQAHGRFVAGDLGKVPRGLMLIVDQLGPIGIGKGHALIVPDTPPGRAAEDALYYSAIIPYGKFTLQLGTQELPIEAVGMKPLLAEFPTLLDDILKPMVESLSAITLAGHARKYRIVRELAEALARGQPPARFFSQRYPFGLSAPLAFELAGKLQKVFSGVSLVPRMMAGSVGTLASLGAYYLWLINPRPDVLPQQVPIFVWDGGLALLLCLNIWFVISLIGQRLLRKLVPTPVSLRAGGGLVGLLFASLLLAGCIGLLVWPLSRPEWMNVGLHTFLP